MTAAKVTKDELRKELEDERAARAQAELELDEARAQLDEKWNDEERLTRAADMAHALHDQRTPRRLCRQEMCQLFEDGGL